MDPSQLEIISQFKQRVFASHRDPLDSIGILNRGHKLAVTEGPIAEVIELTLKIAPKVVEYDARNYFVLTSDDLGAVHTRSKRKWYQTFDPVLDEDDDDENEPVGDEDHPYKQVDLASLLAPINHPLEIVSHPAVARTYKLPIFNKLAMELIELIEVEQNNLNWLNKLLLVLNGEDWYYLLDEQLGLSKYDHGLDVDKKENGSSRMKEEPGEDPFFALPEALKKYDAQQLPPSNDEEDSALKEELINYLQVLIQRQHEYINNLTKIRNGLVRADRLKRDIYKWSKEMHDRKLG